MLYKLDFLGFTKIFILFFLKTLFNNKINRMKFLQFILPEEPL